MGYIKTEEAVEALYRYGFVTKETIAKNIRAIPSIDIVRCRECRHFEKNESILRGEWWCDLWADTIEDDGYCSYGEREGE